MDGVKNPKSQGGKTNILLVRTGEAKRGVIGLFQAGLKNEHSRGLSVRFRGIDNKGVASYLLSLYCSAAILADDAIAVLEDEAVPSREDAENMVPGLVYVIISVTGEGVVDIRSYKNDIKC